jgi:hypothetical protein
MAGLVDEVCSWGQSGLKNDARGTRAWAIEMTRFPTRIYKAGPDWSAEWGARYFCLAPFSDVTRNSLFS